MTLESATECVKELYAELKGYFEIQFQKDREVTANASEEAKSVSYKDLDNDIVFNQKLEDKSLLMLVGTGSTEPEAFLRDYAIRYCVNEMNASIAEKQIARFSDTDTKQRVKEFSEKEFKSIEAKLKLNKIKIAKLLATNEYFELPGDDILQIHSDATFPSELTEASSDFFFSIQADMNTINLFNAYYTLLSKNIELCDIPELYKIACSKDT